MQDGSSIFPVVFSELKKCCLFCQPRVNKTNYQSPKCQFCFHEVFNRKYNISILTRSIKSFKTGITQYIYWVHSNHQPIVNILHHPCKCKGFPNISRVKKYYKVIKKRLNNKLHVIKGYKRIQAFESFPLFTPLNSSTEWCHFIIISLWIHFTKQFANFVSLHAI